MGHLVVEKFIYLLLLEWVTESPGGKGKYLKTLTEKLSTLQMSENLTCYFPLLATYYFQKRFYLFESFPLSIEHNPILHRLKKVAVHTGGSPQKKKKYKEY